MLKQRNNNGFTVVELLIVIVVIAILAAIVLIAYNGAQQRARASAASSAVNQAKKKLQLYQVDTGSYPLTSNLAAAGVSNSNDISYQYTGVDGSTYCITATNGNVSFKATESAPPSAGACAGHTQANNPTIINLVTNPNPSGSYWFSSNTSAATVSFTTSNGVLVARSTKASTTTPYALYSTRGAGSVAVAQQGDTYSILFTAMASIDTTIIFRMGYGSSTSTANLPSSDLTVALTANQPKIVKHQITIPSGYNGQPIFNKFYWDQTSGAVGDYFDISKVMWVKGSYSGSYADGDSPGWSWSGGNNSSTSSGPGS